MGAAINMVGQKFGDIDILERVGTASSRDAIWRYRCVCGEIHKASGYAIRSGKTTCCPKCAAKKVGQCSVTHGLTESPEYGSWTDMKTRCLNPNSTSYSGYGGRGISICDRWADSFEAFLSDMGPKPTPDHSIDRIDNDGNYEPANCRWATRIEQARNRRNFRETAGVIEIEINGVVKPLVDWCEEYECKPKTAYLRFKNGLRGEDVFRRVGARLKFKGIEDTISGWAERTGIKKNTISMRVNKYGWPVGRALTEGARQW